MQKNYNLSHRLIAYILFISLFLQSCGNSFNQLITHEKEPLDDNLKSTNKEIDIKPLVGKELTAAVGNLVNFYEQDGRLKADVRVDEKQSRPNYKNLPVEIEKETILADLTKLDSTTQQNRIKLGRNKVGRIEGLVILNGGVAGGMKQSRTSNNSTSNDDEDSGSSQDREKEVIGKGEGKERKKKKKEEKRLKKRRKTEGENEDSDEGKEESILLTQPNELLIKILSYIPDDKIERVKNMNSVFDLILTDILNTRLKGILRDVKNEYTKAGVQPYNLNWECSEQENKCNEIDKLIRLGADPNIKIDGFPTYVCAETWQAPQIARILRERAASSNIVLRNRMDDITRILHGECDVFKIDIGDNYDTSDQEVEVNDNKLSLQYLYLAANEGNVEFIENLFQSELRNDPAIIKEYINTQDNQGLTALHRAAWNDHANVATLLISEGANIDIRDRCGRTPLHWAASKDNLDVTTKLIQLGINIHSTDENGNTPLHVAARQGNIKVVQFLIEQGARLSKNYKGDTPINLAKNGHHTAIINILVSKKAEYIQELNSIQNDNLLKNLIDNIIKEQDEHEQGEIINRALTIAAWGGNIEAVKLLIQLGANVNVQDYHGNTPLHMAAIGNNKDKAIINLLIQLGADISIRNIHGDTYDKYIYQ